MLEATRERRPPHYHVAVYPEALRGLREGVDAGGRGRERGDGAGRPRGRRGPGGRCGGRARGAARGQPRPDRPPLRGDGGRAAPRERPRLVAHPSGSVAPGSRAERPADPAAGGSGEAPVAGGSGKAPAAGRSGEAPADDAAAVHVVRRGDSLDRIARRYGATVEGLRRANGLGSSLIHPGQSLRVPGAERPAAPAAGGSGEAGAGDAMAVHVVRRGDSLDRIARRYGSTVAGCAARTVSGRRSSIRVSRSAFRGRGRGPVCGHPARGAPRRHPGPHRPPLRGDHSRPAPCERPPLVPHPSRAVAPDPPDAALGVCAVERCRLLAGLVGRPAEPKATMGGLGVCP